MKGDKKNPVCSTTAALDILGGKWKVFILTQLVQGTRRFGELKKAIPAVTQKMLTQQLRELEEVGLVTRKVFPEVPPRVEYKLTAHGFTLEPVLKALYNWGSLHRDYLGLESLPNCRPNADLPPAPKSLAAPAFLAEPLSYADLTEAVRAAAM